MRVADPLRALNIAGIKTSGDDLYPVLRLRIGCRINVSIIAEKLSDIRILPQLIVETVERRLQRFLDVGPGLIEGRF